MIYADFISAQFFNLRKSAKSAGFKNLSHLLFKNLKTNDFDFIAEYYQSLSNFVFGKTLVKSQIYFLNKIPNYSTVLLVGEGSGSFLEQLILGKICKKIVVVEPSENMIQLAKKRIENLDNESEIVFINDVLESTNFSEKFDCVVTNFLFDLFTEQKIIKLMQILKNLLKTDGIWLFTDFRINNHSIHRIWQVTLMKIMYLFFAVVSKVEARKLADFSKIFKELQLLKIHQKLFFSGMIESAVYRK